ncbi:hypothetical protein BDB00DRAFT_173122 [Zychaea mexicana]|uniref:uncharacterized protein n=1 Tax=Zychaea mexicana TaxID=64656 RepID=UPI0022FE862C|nr:uncharacterized protein BDB00DRAFT_173122 [Zychaea mexicana]KAI9479627.1 hypothetical protein BDB00DRAFT_173122 [Zychaea mexicana]
MSPRKKPRHLKYRNRHMTFLSFISQCFHHLSFLPQIHSLTLSMPTTPMPPSLFSFRQIHSLKSSMPVPHLCLSFKFTPYHLLCLYHTYASISLLFLKSHSTFIMPVSYTLCLHLSFLPRNSHLNIFYAFIIHLCLHLSCLPPNSFVNIFYACTIHSI